MSRCSVKMMSFRAVAVGVEHLGVSLEELATAPPTCGRCPTSRTCSASSSRARPASRSRLELGDRAGGRWPGRRAPPRAPRARSSGRSSIVEVLVEVRTRRIDRRPSSAASSAPRLRSRSSATRFSSRSRRRRERLVDRLRRRGQAALEDREREADDVPRRPSPSPCSRSARFISSRTYSVTALVEQRFARRRAGR